MQQPSGKEVLGAQAASPEALQSRRLLGEAGETEVDLAATLRKTLPFTACLVVIYTVTLAIFPGVLVEDVSSADLGSW